MGDKLRRHHVVPATGAPVDCDPIALSGTWRGCWNERPELGAARPFVQELVFDAAGGVSGSGTDSNGDPFQIAGAVWRDGAITRIRWLKNYGRRLHDEVEYDGVLVGGTVAGHFAHRRCGGPTGTFALARGGTTPAVARRSGPAVLFTALHVAGFLSTIVLAGTVDSWVNGAVVFVWSTIMLAGVGVPDRLLRRSRRQLAMLSTGETEPRALPPARLVKQAPPLTPR